MVMNDELFWLMVMEYEKEQELLKYLKDNNLRIDENGNIVENDTLEIQLTLNYNRRNNE